MKTVVPVDISSTRSATPEMEIVELKPEIEVEQVLLDSDKGNVLSNSFRLFGIIQNHSEHVESGSKGREP